MTRADDIAQAAASLKVVRGEPDEAELAALVAGMVAYASAGDGDEDPGSPRSAWMNRQRSLRGRRVGVLGKGDNAWRHSLR